MRRAELSRLFWIGAAVLLCIAALVALFALLRGSFTDTDGEVLLTLSVLFLAGSAAIAGFALVERARAAALGWTVVATAPIWFAVTAAVIWSGGSHPRWAGTALVLLVAELVLTTSILMLRDRRFVWLVAATGIALGLTTSLSIVAIWNHGLDLAKSIGAFAILTALGYFLTPVLQRFAATRTAITPVGEAVLATLDDIELVSSRGPIEGLEVAGRPSPGEHLVLRRRQPGA